MEANLGLKVEMEKWQSKRTPLQSLAFRVDCLTGNGESNGKLGE